MLSLTGMIKALMRSMAKETLFGPMKRATVIREFIPAVRPLAMSGNEYISAMQEVGMSYRRTDMLADLRLPVETSHTGVVSHGEDMMAAPFLPFGKKQFRYDVNLWSEDPQGDWSDEEGVSWSMETRSVWSDTILSDEEIIAVAKDRIEAAEEEEYDPDESWYPTERKPQEYTVGGLHAYKAQRETKEAFPWQTTILP